MKYKHKYDIIALKTFKHLKEKSNGMSFIIISGTHPFILNGTFKENTQY